MLSVKGPVTNVSLTHDSMQSDKVIDLNNTVAILIEESEDLNDNNEIGKKMANGVVLFFSFLFFLQIGS